MIAHNSNEGSRHIGVVWFIWYAADCARTLGQLVAIDYSDSTPDVAYTYDRLGWQLTVTDVLGTRTNVYSPTALLEERHPDGTALVRSYDTYGRASGIALGSDYAVSYGYDEYGRFSTVAVSNGPTFTYTYLPGTSLLVGYTNTLGLSVAYAYEPHRDVKTLVSNAWGTNVISTFAYTYDAIGRRTQRIDDGITTNLFGYNLRSELTSAEMGTNVYSYAYDPIGNRTSASENGLTNLYAANELNQYTALNPASTNPTPFTYDADGNMTSDGTWSCTWDAENRLIEVQPLATNLGSALVQYMYDAQSRRIARREFAWNDYLCETTWHYVQGRAYRYDGWNLLQERKPAIVPRTPHPYISQTNLALAGIGGPVAASYLWGLDLSSTLQGAGGIGGLLMQRHSDTDTPWFSFCDANGNVTDLLDEDAFSIAHYEYDSYGNAIIQTGDCVSSNHFRFSTKHFENKPGLIDFGYRFYSPKVGRWMSPDPIQEAGGFNLYAFAKNGPEDNFDSIGLACEIIVKRITSDITGRTDKYGHEWLEVGGGTSSYGWWPITHVSIKDSLVGVPGAVNRGYAQDPHNRDVSDIIWETEIETRSWIFFNRKLEAGRKAGTPCKCVSCGDILDCLNSFANSYAGTWAIWRSCRTFSKEALNACCLKKARRLLPR